MNSLIITKCPHCGSELQFDGIHLTCPNDNCSGRLAASFYDRCKVLNIKGLGEKMANIFSGCGVTDPIRLIRNGLNDPSFNGMKITKNMQKVFDELSSIKSLTLEQVILCKGFVGIGPTTAKQIARQMSDLDYDYTGLEKSVVAGFQKTGPKYIKIMMDVEVLKHGGIDVEFSTDDVKVENTINIEFTGSPKPAFKTKDEFLSTIASKGFVHTKLKDASILVTDSYSSTSSKMTEATKKGIEIITYTDFVQKYCK